MSPIMSDSDEILFDDIYELHEVIGKELLCHLPSGTRTFFNSTVKKMRGILFLLSVDTILLVFKDLSVK